MKIGLMLPIADEPASGRPPSFDHLRGMTLAAEEGGLDSVWCPDHVLFRSDENDDTRGIHEAWTLLSALAAVTSRVELGPLVLCVPFRNPAMIAKMAATLEEVSGGRLVLGLGCGWHEPEFDAFGLPFDHRVGRFEEALEIIMPMLRTGSATFGGRWHRASRADLVPRGPRSNGPPIMIAGKQPRMLELVAKHADQWNAAWYGHPDDADELRERLTRLRAALDAAGRDPATLELTAGVFVKVADDDDAPENAMHGSTEEIADALAGYADLGISHLVVHLWPRTPAAVTQLAQAAALARERVPAPA
ncbi:MAG TPA: LLM class flavin-dependent oxidoreductase [Candidatus Binatia bacterium]|nr:LLM class flavin-dependent oxidoreductase [Candidatus Binatia bacterium]